MTDTFSVQAMKRQRVYQFVTGLQIAFSALSLVIICLTLPVMFNNVQHTIDYVENEMRFCERSNREALVEVELGRAFKRANGTRARRANYGGYAAQGTNPTYASEGENESGGHAATGGEDGGYGNDVNIIPVADSTGTPIENKCPGCCIPGPSGPRGASGTPGKPGLPGPAGKPGIPGMSPNQTCPVHTQREPPACRPCPKGPPGPKGWPGFPGDVGPGGPPGDKGRDGDDGAQGEDGPQGPPGFRGSPGAPGDKGITPSGEVREGPPGDPGPVGPVGAPGVPGLPGRNGLTGPQGERGWSGSAGESGEPGYPGAEGMQGAAGPPGQPGTCVCQNVDSVILVGPSAAQPRVPEAQEIPYSSVMSAAAAGGYGR